MVLTTSFDEILVRHFFNASNPPNLLYSLKSLGFIKPLCSVAMFICPFRNSETGVSSLSEEYLRTDLGTIVLSLYY